MIRPNKHNEDGLPVEFDLSDHNDDGLPLYTKKKVSLGGIGGNAFKNGGTVGKSNAPSVVPSEKKETFDEWIANKPVLAVNPKDPVKDVKKKSFEATTRLMNLGKEDDPLELLEVVKAAKDIENSLVADGFEAIRVLNTTNFGNEGDDNLTAKALRQKADKYNKAVQPFRDLQFFYGNEQTDNPLADYNAKEKFYAAAIKAYAEKNPLFKQQISVAGVQNIESNAKRGQVIELVMKDPDFVAYLTKENPNLLPLVEQVNKDLYVDNKDYGINKVANKVSRAIEKSGYNDIEPIFNFAGNDAKEMADLTAQTELTPEEYKIYKENNVFEKLDMPSFFEGFATRAKQIIKSTGDSFTTIFTPTSSSVLKQWDTDANHVNAEPKGFNSWIRDVGDVAGLIATIGATANLTGIANPQTAGAAATILNFFGQEVENKKAEYPNKPVTAITLGSVNTLLYALLAKDIFPAAKIKSAFSSVQPEIKKVVENFTSGKIGLEAARKELQTSFKKATDFVGGTLAKNTKVSLELAGIQGVNRLMDRLAGMSDERFAEIHPDDEIGSGIIHTFSTFAPISAMGRFGEMKNRNRVVEETIYDAVSKPQQTERLINEAAINLSFGTINEVKENFKIAFETKKELDALGIHPKEQKRFIFEALKEKAAKDALEASQDPVIQKKNKDLIKESQEIKEKILNGEEADNIVTESQQKKIDEQQDYDRDVERIAKAKELDQKEYDEKRAALDGRRPEDRIKIEKLEQQQKEKNEDYDNKLSKLMRQKGDLLMQQGKNDPTFLKEQSLDAPNGLKVQLGSDEAVIDVIAKNTPEDIKEALKKWTDKMAEAEGGSREFEEAENHVALLEKGLEKQAESQEAAKPKEEAVAIDQNRELDFGQVEEVTTPTESKQPASIEEVSGQVFYHGTKKGGDLLGEKESSVTGNPTAGWGLFFTPEKKEAQRYVDTFHNKDGEIIEASLDLKKPYEMSFKEYDDFVKLDLGQKDATVKEQMAANTERANEFKKELESQGYDGIIIGVRGKSRSQEVVVFNNSQIKPQSNEQPIKPKPKVEEVSGEARQKIQAEEANKQAEKKAELESQRDAEIFREKMPEMKDVNEAVPSREAISVGSGTSEKLVENKKMRQDFKNKYSKLKELFECLTKQ